MGAGMGGIVGLVLKNLQLEPRLGEVVVPMLDVLSSRGPDSRGGAVYTDDAPDGTTKYSLSTPSAEPDWSALADGLRERLGEDVGLRRRGRDAVVVTRASAAATLESLGELAPTVRLAGFGHFVEVYKDVGPAFDVCERYGISAMAGYPAIGHTRMATEAAVT